MSRIKYDMVSGDTKRTIVNKALLDRVALDLTGWTIECHQTDTATDAVVTFSTVTADADQTSNPGQFSTEFTAGLVTGSYVLEWEMTHSGALGIITFPGDEDLRPSQTVRAEGA